MSYSFKKPTLEALQTKTEAFHSKRLICNFLEYPFHYHPEYELTYFIRGKGTRYAGNSVEEFEDNDFVLMGSNLPHVWKSASEYCKDSNLVTDCIVIQFSDDFLGEQFFELTEMLEIKKLLRNAQSGVKFSDTLKKKLRTKLKRLVKYEGARKIALFIEILDACSKDKDAVLLSPSTEFQDEEGLDKKRFATIYSYMVENLDKDIAVKDLAELVGLAENSFSRYFKKHNGEPYVKFLNKLRIETACSMIRAGNDNFTQIALEVGYNSLSYFNRQFKSYKGETAGAYMKRYI